MPVSVEIKCVSKSGSRNPHERIKRVGGKNSDGTRWKLSATEAIAGIESNKWTFWTQGGGQRSEVYIAINNGKKYLKTRADTIEKDILLILPECP